MKRIAIASLAAVALTGCSKAPNVRGFADVPAPQTYYVSSSTGLDTNAGTQDKPLKSLAVAIKRMGPGDTLLLKAGDTWTADCITTTADSQHFAAYGSGKQPVIGSGCVHAITSDGKDGLSIMGMNVTGSTQEGIFAINGGNGGTIQGNTVGNTGLSGILVRNKNVINAAPMTGWNISKNSVGKVLKTGLNYGVAGIQTQGLTGAIIANNTVSTVNAMGIQDRPYYNATCARNTINKNQVINSEGGITGVCDHDVITYNGVKNGRGFGIQGGTNSDVGSNYIAHLAISTDKTLYNGLDMNGAANAVLNSNTIIDVSGCSITAEGTAKGVRVNGGNIDATSGGKCALYVTASANPVKFDGKTIWKTDPSARTFKVGGLAWSNMMTQATFLKSIGVN